MRRELRLLPDLRTVPGRRGIGALLGAAALFGASTPAAKVVLDAASPWMVAALLYLGAGVGLGVIVALRRRIRSRLSRGETLSLAGAIACGGIAGPVLLMQGLDGLSASSASLLLNAEGVLTTLGAWFVFRENFDRRVALGAAAIAGGAVALVAGGGIGRAAPGPALLILAACACWALDNNLTRRVALADPVELAGLKGLVAGATNLALALGMGAAVPAAGTVAASMAIGFLGYGASLALFIVGLRELGTARAAAWFSTAPFQGALLGVVALGDPLTGRLAVAGGLMALGTWLHLTEHHEHEHDHEALEHEHEHEHDEHHLHVHDDGVIGSGRHSHRHRHEPMRHSHRHAPDAHHRHEH